MDEGLGIAVELGDGRISEPEPALMTVTQTTWVWARLRSPRKGEAERPQASAQRIHRGLIGEGGGLKQRAR